MADTQVKTPTPPKPPSRVARVLRVTVLVVVAVSLLSLLATWLGQRSLRTPAKKRAIQSWLDENLNADVLLHGDMVVRLNLVRNSRIVFYDTEIEHPNPLFPGKFASIGRMGIWVPPWSAYRIMPGRAQVLVDNARIAVEENEAGEWSNDGLMRPLAGGNAALPFPFPKVSDWRAHIRSSALRVRRRGYELSARLDGDVFARTGRDRIRMHFDRMPFTFGPVGGQERQAGVAGPVNIQVRQEKERGALPTLIPGACDVTVSNLPAGALPFFVGGIPLENASGTFNGRIRYNTQEGAAGALHIDGDLVDVPLAIFGLPRTTPLRVTWPVRPEGDGSEAHLRIGPSGFGAFEIGIPLDREGNPALLSMRGEFAVLDDLPALFSEFSRWPQWLSRTFPAVEWRAGKWRGFGWGGDNMRLSISRATAGLNLTGEGELMGGRVRIAMTPEQREAPITIAAERVDTALFTDRISQMLPAPFRARVTGSHVNLTWRGYPSPDGGFRQWSSGMVWAKPVVHLDGSGSWWLCFSELAEAIARALPEWGGGDPSGLRSISRLDAIHLDQLSVVSEYEQDSETVFGIRAFGDSFGQASGIVERRRDGTVEGELLIAGDSLVLREAARANPDLAAALDLLANDSPGLRIVFSAEAEGEPEFSFPFLDDALRIHEELSAPAEAGQ